MDREQLIRERAYAIWQAEGRPEGCEQEHWARATRDIDEQADGSAPVEDAGDRDTAPAAPAAPADPVGSIAQSPSPAPTAAEAPVPTATPAPAPAPAPASSKRGAPRKTQSGGASSKRKGAKTPA